MSENCCALCCLGISSHMKFSTGLLNKKFAFNSGKLLATCPLLDDIGHWDGHVTGTHVLSVCTGTLYY